MNLCAIADGKAVDEKLQTAYEQLSAKVSPEGKIKLEAAEKAWAEYRRRQCEFDSWGSHDGSINPMVISECYAALADKQREELEGQLYCIEGDAFCGRQ